MTEPVPADLLEIADALVPGAPLEAARLAQGTFHYVVTIPGVAAVRIAKRAPASEAMGRRTERLRLLAASGLPFAVPEPLTPVTMFGERAAVAVSWIAGEGLAVGEGDPSAIGGLLEALRVVPITPELRAVLNTPHEYSGGPQWVELMIEAVIPRLPERWRDNARRRVEDVLALDPVPDALVHGDLCGGNVHWGADGTVIGVLDWDVAHAFDPAIDAMWMGWHGWRNVRGAVDSETYRRAGVWYRAFSVEPLAATFLDRYSPEHPLHLERYVRHLVDWLEEWGDWQLP
ncbi:MAG TPA: aminoglycoside phosphotransferase family protein [Candidatus Dormibacteraeota bacterium]|jgi:aminoglycoside phosphotransferase (APT) family kinase protein